MKTIMAKPETVKRAWVLIDAANQPLGRVATACAYILRGKHKPTYTPHVDTGDYVVVINTDKIVLTGNKAIDKRHFHYSGFPGGAKFIQYKDLMATRSDFALEEAVRGMLPKNTLGKEMFLKLKAYKGAEHPHAAQNPQPIVIKGVLR